MRIFTLILGMTAFTCGEKASEGTSDGATGTTGEVSTSGTEAPTGSASDSASGEPTSAGPTTGAEPSTSGAESTGSDSSISEGTAAGESTAGETGTTGELVVVDAGLVDACAPDDGPAVELRPGLVEPACDAKWSDEALRIVIFAGAPLLPGVYPLDGGMGFATRQGVNDPDFITGMTGSVTIEAWDDVAVTGSYHVEFADASVRAGGFSGPFCAVSPPCG